MAHNHAPTSQTHDHDHASHSHGAEAEGIIELLQGNGNRGAYVTLLGLLTNIGLTAVKGAAGYFLNSAVLIADAGHSLSDLMGDLVTLIFYTLSRRPASSAYPYGYGKFESIGTSTVAVFLLLGAWAIGLHSISQTLEAFPAIGRYFPSFISSLTLFGSHSDDHHHEADATDPNAAWIAVFSIIVKESMYRLSASVAKAENSPVLMANALHHRSDMYSSFVSLVAILGNWILPSVPLDPIGGLLVTLLILHQASELLGSSLYELTDHGLPQDEIAEVKDIIKSTAGAFTAPFIVDVSDICAIRRGAHLYVDATVDVQEGDSTSLTLRDVVVFEDDLKRALRVSRKDIKDVRLRLAPVS